jgi:hypothetical protein
MQRKKVPLAPGHTLADWYKLIHSGVDMGGSGRLLRVTPEEVHFSVMGIFSFSLRRRKK